MYNVTFIVIDLALEAAWSESMILQCAYWGDCREGGFFQREVPLLNIPVCTDFHYESFRYPLELIFKKTSVTGKKKK